MFRPRYSSAELEADMVAERTGSIEAGSRKAHLRQGTLARGKRYVRTTQKVKRDEKKSARRARRRVGKAEIGKQVIEAIKRGSPVAGANPKPFAKYKSRWQKKMDVDVTPERKRVAKKAARRAQRRGGKTEIGRQVAEAILAKRLDELLYRDEKVVPGKTTQLGGGRTMSTSTINGQDVTSWKVKSEDGKWFAIIVRGRREAQLLLPKAGRPIRVSVDDALRLKGEADMHTLREIQSGKWKRASDRVPMAASAERGGEPLTEAEERLAEALEWVGPHDLVGAVAETLGVPEEVAEYALDEALSETAPMGGAAWVALKGAGGKGGGGGDYGHDPEQGRMRRERQGREAAAKRAAPFKRKYQKLIRRSQMKRSEKPVPYRKKWAIPARKPEHRGLDAEKVVKRHARLKRHMAKKGRAAVAKKISSAARRGMKMVFGKWQKVKPGGATECRDRLADLLYERASAGPRAHDIKVSGVKIVKGSIGDRVQMTLTHDGESYTVDTPMIRDALTPRLSQSWQFKAANELAKFLRTGHADMIDPASGNTLRKVQPRMRVM